MNKIDSPEKADTEVVIADYGAFGKMTRQKMTSSMGQKAEVDKTGPESQTLDKSDKVTS